MVPKLEIDPDLAQLCQTFSKKWWFFPDLPITAIDSRIVRTVRIQHIRNHYSNFCMKVPSCSGPCLTFIFCQSKSYLSFKTQLCHLLWETLVSSFSLFLFPELASPCFHSIQHIPLSADQPQTMGKKCLLFLNKGCALRKCRE